MSTCVLSIDISVKNKKMIVVLPDIKLNDVCLIANLYWNQTAVLAIVLEYRSLYNDGSHKCFVSSAIKLFLKAIFKAVLMNERDDIIFKTQIIINMGYRRSDSFGYELTTIIELTNR